jgi:hypothetical protein
LKLFLIAKGAEIYFCGWEWPELASCLGPCPTYRDNGGDLKKAAEACHVLVVKIYQLANRTFQNKVFKGISDMMVQVKGSSAQYHTCRYCLSWVDFLA